VTHPFQGNLEAYMKYPAAHEEELLEILPAPIGEKGLNPRQSFKVCSKFEDYKFNIIKK
jgi:hypothetical protein